ncbi:MAG: FtsX-like permease family protein [Pseudomonadales bacterium]
MRALDRKALRDLWRLRGQVLAVGLVIASGVAVLVMSLSTLEALEQSAATYYERYRFAEVFAGLKRGPERLADRIASIPGVQTVQTRIVRYATLDIPGFAEPVIGQFVSIPDQGAPLLNRLVYRSGGPLAPGRHDQVLVSEPFAEAHGLRPGDRLDAVLDGHRRTLYIAGVVLSPEFIYSLGPGALLPDDLRFGVMWMSRQALEAAFDLDGSFNNVTLDLLRGVDPDDVIAALDGLLEPYGGVGAIARADQLSHWFVTNEIAQLATMSRILPAIFLVIAAFLTHMVLSRLIAMERSQIGLMKAFGYSAREIAGHYAKLVVAIALVGILIGLLIGVWFGRLNTAMYADLFRFPTRIYVTSSAGFMTAAGLSLLAALAGASSAVWRAVRLPPAQAMAPPAPPVFRRSRLASTRLWRWLDQPTRIILRNIGRWPVRAGLTAVGLSASVALLVLTLQWNDSLDYLAQTYFFDTQRQHVMLGFAETRPTSVLQEVRRLPGVLAAEPMRIVSADFKVGHRTHRGALSGVPEPARLQPVFDDERSAVVAVPLDGLILGERLARKLRVGQGDSVDVHLLEGRRPVLTLVVADTVATHIAMPAYVHIHRLDRALRERPGLEYVSLLIDSRAESLLYEELKNLPAVSAVMLRQAAIDSFYATVIDHIMVYISMFTVLACTLGVGVAYNSVRIALSERGRELATLRVLGFSRGEISYILLGEVALLAVLALPLGCVVGRGLTIVMASSFDTELFRVPLTIEPSTFGMAMLISLAATALSAGLVRRRVDRLDLVEVLKTRE